MTTPFVGRAGELAALTADLDAAVGGRGGVVLVAGEPGIGKTRLAEELAARASRARRRGAVGSLLGRGGRALVLALGSGRPRLCAGPGRDPASLRHDLGAGAADIAQLVPAVHDCIPDLPAPPPLEPEAARFRLFDSLAGFLRTAAARRPLLLVLDDLHWADVPSLALLRFMSRELAGVEGSSPLVVGSYRHTEVDQGHPLLAAVADLTRGQHRWLLLGGLGQRDVASFVALVAGAEPSAELAAEVYRQTDGNPFFVTEVVRLLASQGRLDPAARGATVLGAGCRKGSGRWWPSGSVACPATAGGSWRSPRWWAATSSCGCCSPPAAWTPSGYWRCWRRPRPHGWSGRSLVGSAAGGSRTRWSGRCCTRACSRRGACACTGWSGRRLRPSTPPTRGRIWRSWPTIWSRRHPAARRRRPRRCRWPRWPAGAPWRCWPGRTRPSCSSGRWPPWNWPNGPAPSAALRAAAGGRRGQDGGQRRARRPHRLPAGRGAGQADRLARGARPGRPGPGVGVHQRDRRPGPGRAAGGGTGGPG